jgi:hypothetical protein
VGGFFMASAVIPTRSYNKIHQRQLCPNIRSCARISAAVLSYMATVGLLFYLAPMSQVSYVATVSPVACMVVRLIQSKVAAGFGLLIFL